MGIKISVCMICAEEEEFLGLSLSSFADHVDEIIIVGNPNDKTKKLMEYWIEHGKLKFTWRDWDNNFGAARQAALDAATGDWIFAIDCDEYLDNAFQLRHIISEVDAAGFNVIDVTYEHFIRHLGALDATTNQHVGLMRVFKKTPGVKYRRDIHEYAFDEAWMVNGELRKAFTTDLKLWHFGYLKGITTIKDKYHINVAKGAHTPQFLEWWKTAHIIGAYPVKPTDFSKVPKKIMQWFGVSEVKLKPAQVDVDELSPLEAKHFQMVAKWYTHFMPNSVLDVGCGWGHFLFAWAQYPKLRGGVFGLELDQKRVDKCPYAEVKELVKQGSVLSIPYSGGFGLVIGNDLLEHIEERDVDLAIIELAKQVHPVSGRLLLSVCYEGDPNFLKDPTHKVCKPKTWWQEKLRSHGLVEEEVPEYFMYREQYTIWRKT